MSNEILAKGSYSHPQISEFITARQYMFISKDDKRYLTVRFCNDTGVTVNAICVELLQLDGRGTTLKKTRVSEESLLIFPGTDYTPSSLPELDDKCVDVRVRIIYALSGAYKYTVRGHSVAVHYIPPRRKPADRNSLYRTYGGYRPKRRLFALVVVAILVGMIGANTVQTVIPFLEEQGVFEYISELVGFEKDEPDAPQGGGINNITIETVRVDEKN